MSLQRQSLSQGLLCPTRIQRVTGSGGRIDELPDKAEITPAQSFPSVVANGIVDGMNLRIDKAERPVLPKSVRSQWDITPDTALELVHSSDGILIHRVSERQSITDRRPVGSPGHQHGLRRLGRCHRQRARGAR